MKKRQVDLATTVTVNTNYQGEFAGKYCGAALLSGDTLAKGMITIKPNVKHKETAKKVATSNIIADATCDFTPTGTVQLDDRVLTPKELQVNVQLCKDPFQKDWDAISMGYSAFDHLPAKFSDYLIGNFSATVGENTEKDIWMGDGSAGHFNGYVPMFTADAAVIDVAGVAAGTVTGANVIAEITKVLTKVPLQILNKPDFALYVAPDVALAYSLALGNAGFQTDYWAGAKPMNFGGYKMYTVPGLDPSYMVAAEKDNLWFGTGLMSDFNEVRVIDMAMIDGSQNVRFVMRYTAGVQYCIGAEIVLYTPV